MFLIPPKDLIASSTLLCAMRLCSCKFSTNRSLFTENPLSTVAFPWEKIRLSLITCHSSEYCVLPSNIDEKKSSNLFDGEASSKSVKGPCKDVVASSQSNAFCTL